MIIGSFIFLIGMIPIYLGAKYYAFRKVVIDTPTSKIWDLHKGLVELNGEVVPSEKGTMTSPILQKECVYYKYRIQEYRSHGKSGSYVTISEGEKHRLFYLQDLTGFVLVDSRQAKFEIFNKYKITTGFFKNVPVSAIPFLQKNNISFKAPFLGCKNMRFEEQAIVPYSKIYLLGNVENRFNVEDISRKSGETECLIQKGKKDEIYYISDAAEKEILKKYKTRVCFGFGFGIAAFVIGGILIASSFMVF